LCLTFVSCLFRYFILIHDESQKSDSHTSENVCSRLLLHVLCIAMRHKVTVITLPLLKDSSNEILFHLRRGKSLRLTPIHYTIPAFPCDRYSAVNVPAFMSFLISILEYPAFRLIPDVLVIRDSSCHSGDRHLPRCLDVRRAIFSSVIWSHHLPRDGFHVYMEVRIIFSFCFLLFFFFL
jgi:hypothetical protein